MINLISIKNIEEEKARVKQIMDQLHRYNQAKDVAQSLLGRLATMQGCTTRQLYDRFDLSLDD